ncbi:MAG: DNA polymerase III subunit gamma/tau [Solobacterium sp.]|nr:DNA polymerase III subunit gamma/tau [Solobacterium sp.]
MGRTALYQKYRSTTFEEVVGQEYVVKSIRNAVRNDKVGHAYLFCGPRGTGKTTMARLLAKSVNCENRAEAPCGHCENCIASANGSHPDIIEINAANETHVENIRELIDRARLAPMQGKYKIYIIDEVHQLSSAASSALLKTLEEPPENVIFVLATTDPQKLLPTIISRCQRFDFTSVNAYQIRDHLMKIGEKEGIYINKDAAMMIADLSEGGMRDALSIMDQCAAYTDDHITLEEIDKIYGLTTTEEKVDLIHNINTGDIEEILHKMERYEQQGLDLQRYTDGLIEILKDCTVYAGTGKKELLSILSEEQAEFLSKENTSGAYLQMAQEFLETKNQFRFAVNAISCMEIRCLKLLNDQNRTAAAEPVIVRQSAPKPVVKRAAEVVEKPAEITPEPPQQTSEKTVEEPEEKPTEIQSEPVTENHAGMNISEPEILTSDKIVELLVQCNKQAKIDTENTFMHVSDEVTLEDQKYLVLLNQAKIAAAGKDCAVLTVHSQAVANRINDPLMNEQLYFFLQRTAQIEKMLYAVPESVYQDAVRLFVEKRKAGTLPQPCAIQKYAQEVIKELTPEEKVISLFGKENVTIIGGN